MQHIHRGTQFLLQCPACDSQERQNDFQQLFFDDWWSTFRAEPLAAWQLGGRWNVDAAFTSEELACNSTSVKLTSKEVLYLPSAKSYSDQVPCSQGHLG